ncbi:MAG: hypothetical protein J0I42_06650 [Bosea sp.]|uniref:hypothetical protein n=1 Tax=Bosea sp. (in: a-proteobacteria) TaxID=1871050 RepID=UPI001ACF1EEB|nr:hypothetical protein [Bosea sp. (in: a-proteobacteria)]MBN9451616.1 hypothetical protein [Bosea sp. (in: a-proteobacteria)]
MAPDKDRLKQEVMPCRARPIASTERFPWMSSSRRSSFATRCHASGDWKSKERILREAASGPRLDMDLPEQIAEAGRQILEKNSELPFGKADIDDLPMAGVPEFLGKLHKD